MWLFQKIEILLLNPILFVMILMDCVQIAYQSKTEKFCEYQQQNTGSVESDHVKLIRNWESFRYNQSLNIDVNSFPKGTFSSVLQ